MPGFYERLTALDASFVGLEDVNTHMHVAAALVFEPGPLATPDGGLDMERIRAWVESRLHLIPRYRQRLAWVPLERHPVWVDDDRFNLFYHVRHTSLPRPGTERQLKRLCGRILSQKLDLTKPLWEIWVVEGLDDGRFALVSKVHHCMVDGISGVDLLNVLLSPTPEEAVPPPEPWRPRPAPSARELVLGEVVRRASLPIAAVAAAGRALAEPRSALSAAWDRVAGIAEVVGRGFSSASPTPLNPLEIGPHRRFDWVRFDLGRVKAVKSALGGTVNDVVLATVVGAMRRFLRGRGLLPEALDFRALIPVSIRSQSERGALGNRVAQMLATLPIGERDARRRLERVAETTRALKQSHQVAGSELFEEMGDWASTSLLTETIRLATRGRPYNVIVTNVPGPPIPLYLVGARLVESYPMVPLFSNQGLGIALFSYADGLFWGVNADWETVPDLHDFVDALVIAFDELEQAAGVAGEIAAGGPAGAAVAGAACADPAARGAG